jgi:hypothetical protein
MGRRVRDELVEQDNMDSRILYSDPDTSRTLAALPYEELGRVDNGVWVACPDETVRILAERHHAVFLYFQKRDYDGAVSALSASQIEEVIRRRRDRWAPEAMSFVISWLFDLERVCLEGALRLAEQHGGSDMTAEIEKSLVLLQRLAGLDRYQMLPAKAMALTGLEADSRLIATAQSALDAGIPGTEDLSVHLAKRREWALAISHAIAALGAPDFANALPFATAARGVFVHPAGDDFAKDLIESGEPVELWRDGVVYVSTEHLLAHEREQGLSVELLYADASELYGSMESLTTAQLHRDFAARQLRSATDVGRDMLGEIDRLHLHQILMKRQLRGRGDAAKACQSVGLDKQLREETKLLGQSLSHTQSFSRSHGLESVTPRVLFRAAHDTASANISFFAAITAHYWPAIAPELKQIEAMKTSGRGPADRSNTNN